MRLSPDCEQGMVAMSCGAANSYSERGDGLSIAPTRHILVWSMNDPLRWMHLQASNAEWLRFVCTITQACLPMPDSVQPSLGQADTHI